MELIYYCAYCGKFHFSETEDLRRPLDPCPFCGVRYSVNANYSKEEYEALSEQEKIDFKTGVRKQYPEENIQEIVKQLLEEYYRRERIEKGVVYDIDGCRGRHLTVFTDRCIVTTNASVGAILTGNSLDGEKTIFYKDIVGVQFKESGFAIGYLQFETASAQMNNQSSNAFSENTFTFEQNTGDYGSMKEVKDYIVGQVSEYKKISGKTERICADITTICNLFEKDLLTKEEFELLKQKVLSE